MKIVINRCFGGFGLSEVALNRYKQETGKDHVYDWEILRDDPVLVSIVEELTEDSWGAYSELAIVEVPAGVEWEIAEYDGTEWVAETHRTWS